MVLKDTYAHGGDEEGLLRKFIKYSGYGTDNDWVDNKNKTYLVFEKSKANADYNPSSTQTKNNYPHLLENIALPDKIHSEAQTAKWALGAGYSTSTNNVNGYIALPDDTGHLSFGKKGKTGYLTITLPIKSGDAYFSFYLDAIVDKSSSITYRVSGYAWVATSGIPQFSQVFVTPIGSANDYTVLPYRYSTTINTTNKESNNYKIQIGNSDTKWLGDVQIRDILLGWGYSVNDWKTNWGLEVTSSKIDILSGEAVDSMSITADKVKNALTIGNKSYDGSEKIGISLTDIGAASSGHTHNSLQTSNGYFTLQIDNAARISFGGTGKEKSVYFGIEQIDDRPTPTDYYFGFTDPGDGSHVSKTSSAFINAKGFRVCAKEWEIKDNVSEATGYLLVANGGIVAKSAFATSEHTHGNITKDGKLDTEKCPVITNENKQITTQSYDDFTKKLSVFVKGTSDSATGVIGVVPAANYNNDSSNRYLNEKGLWEQVEYKEISNAPKYWADQEISTSASYEATPNVKSLKLGIGTNEATGCTQQYDTTYKCLKFTFS